MPYQIGDVLYANVPEASHNPRPILVLDEPNEDQILWFVGFSHRIPEPCPWYVLKPDWTAPGCGLTMPCVVDCGFTGSLNTALVVDLRGRMSPEFVELVLITIEKYMKSIGV